MTTETWNYYEILDVQPEASQESIYEAYKQAKQTYSLSNPSIFNIFTESEAIDWINMIEEAYSVIGHPNTRRVYDMELTTLTENSLPNTILETSLPQDDMSTPPDGYAQTPISQYQLNKKMEDLISNQDVFDGLFLKKIREYKCIDLKEFSSKTCIAIRHLYAIENNNFSVLPAGVFVRGYIIQYCRILSLDEKKVVPSFMSLLKDANS